MKNPQNDLNKWESMLFTVMKYFPNACLARGCLRDYVLEAETYNDVDIFIRIGSEFKLETYEVLIHNSLKRLSESLGIEEINEIHPELLKIIMMKGILKP